MFGYTDRETDGERPREKEGGRMWVARENGEPRREGGNGLIAVAVDGDKASQYALKWSVDHILSRGDSVLLLHVKQTPPPITNSTEKNYQTIYRQQPDSQTMETFLPFRCFCMRRQVGSYT